MLTRRTLLQSCALGLTAAATSPWWIAQLHATEAFEVTHSDAEWRQLLTPAQYAVLRQSATERPFSSPLLHEKRAGDFSCAGCDRPLFSFSTKFDSGTGWPSFWAPLEKAVDSTRDTSFGMARTAIHCSRCGGHLGHVFDDGPKPTGLRYCMNGVAMKFKPATA
jgi:peptide-methionine (R)-S-oxide reductase